MTLDIEQAERIELGNLVRFVAKSKGLDYSAAERLIPAVYFEGAHICDDDTDDWCREVVEYLKENGIDSVEVYQD